MTAQGQQLTVCAASNPFGSDLQITEVEAGGTIHEILERAGLFRTGCTATVLIDDWEVPQDKWRSVRPKPGRRILVRTLPAGGGGNGNKNALRVVATIVILLVANLTGQYYANAAASAGWSAGAVSAVKLAVTAAVSIGGNYALTALIPPMNVQLMEIPE